MSIYEPRRKIIHNQTIIIILAILCNVFSFFIAPATIFYLIQISPIITLPIIGQISLFFAIIIPLWLITATLMLYIEATKQK